MDNAEEYRRRAEACERDAEQISLSSDRQRLLDIAKGWRKLAEAAEAKSQRPGPRNNEDR